MGISFFGGKCSDHVKLEGKNFTTIEIKIIERIVGIILKDFQQAWSDFYELKLNYVRTETDPQFAGIAQPGDMIILVKFSIDIGSFSGIMSICIPYPTLEPIKKILRENFKKGKIEVDQKWKENIEETIREIFVTLNCVLGVTKITGRQLLSMKADDIILLDQKISDPIHAYIGNKLKFTGHPGSVNNKKAVKIKNVNVE